MIGRTKLDDIEMDDDVKPSNSHIALNVIEDDDGNELKIVRAQHAVRRTRQGRIRHVLHRLFAHCRPSPNKCCATCSSVIRPGNTDRVLDFSTAVTGGLFFSPTVDFLDDPPPLPAPLVTERPAPPASDDGSLSIGSLKGTSQ